MIRYSVKDEVTGKDVRMANSSDAALLAAMLYVARQGNLIMEVHLGTDCSSVYCRGKLLASAGPYEPKPAGRPPAAVVEKVDQSWRPRGPKSATGWQATTRNIKVDDTLLGKRHNKHPLAYGGAFLDAGGEVIHQFSLNDEFAEAFDAWKAGGGKKFRPTEALAGIMDMADHIGLPEEDAHAVAVVVGVVKWDVKGRPGTAGEKPVPGTVSLVVCKTKMLGGYRGRS